MLLLYRASETHLEEEPETLDFEAVVVVVIVKLLCAAMEKLPLVA